MGYIDKINKEVIFDSKSVIESVTNFYNIKNDDMMGIFLAMNTESSQNKIKKDQQTSCTNKKKRENLANIIFNYIYIAQYCQLFLLIWYNNLI